jgi:hypothetical protein
MQLAVNCSSWATAHIAISNLPAWYCLLETASAERLLVTAAVRGHFGIVKLMTLLSVVQQNVPAATLSIVLEHVLVADGDIYSSRLIALTAVVDMIADQQLSFQQLDVRTLARLLRANEAATHKHTAVLIKKCAPHNESWAVGTQ